MKVLGLIVEYNPFHQGHLYHINKAKQLIKPDVTIVIMSGHFVQRGEPAISNKWTRAGVAIKNVEISIFSKILPSRLKIIKRIMIT